MSENNVCKCKIFYLPLQTVVQEHRRARLSDLCSICNVEVILYADDSVLFRHGKKLAEVATRLTIEMKKVSDWLHITCLTLNTDQTFSMYFTSKHTLPQYPDILVDGNKVKQ